MLEENMNHSKQNFIDFLENITGIKDDIGVALEIAYEIYEDDAQMTMLLMEHEAFVLVEN